MTDSTEMQSSLSNNHDDRPKFKRRSKQSRFISNVKGYGRKGVYGRGTYIDDNQFSYFVNIMDAIKEGLESTENKVTMANNVFEQTATHEIHLSSNQIVSKVIENLVGFTDPENFERFQNAFADNFRPICSDKFASHVLQKMIEISFLRSVHTTEDEANEPKEKKKKEDLMSEETYNKTQSFTGQHRHNCSVFLLKISKFLLNNLEDFVWDPCASHIIRTCILRLVGIHESKVPFEKRENKVPFDKHKKPVQVPTEWIDIFKEYANRLQCWPQFSDFPYGVLTSSLLSHICIALRAVDKSMLKHFGKKILVDSFLKVDEADEKKKIEINDNDEATESDNKQEIVMPKVFTTESSVRLLETLLSTAGSKLFTQLYVMLFTGRLKTLALNRVTNFTVQKLIENVQEKAAFESIFDELQSYIEEILKNGHTGVVVAMAAACLRLSTKQGAFVTSLQSALHISGSKEKFNSLITCIIKLKPYEIAIEDKSQFVHLHGSVILQHMLEFSKPIKLVQGLLDMPSSDLVEIFCTSKGSFIADTFFRSKSIGEKSREKLLKHLEGNYLEMAIMKFGSRVIENIFEAGNDVQKQKIAKELADKVNQLNGTVFGRVLFSKLRIETYRLSVPQWKAGFDRAKKLDTLFGSIIK